MTDKYATTDSGAPVPSVEHSLTVGPDGPILLQDHYLIEQMANFNRERIRNGSRTPKAGRLRPLRSPGRQPYRAAVFQPDTRTEMVARFSTVAGERGSPDTWRDPRGFALKFYTSGQLRPRRHNTPVFFIRDPMKFQNFIPARSGCSRRTSATTTCNGISGLWCESAHQVAWLMGTVAFRKTWRHMNGYSSHLQLAEQGRRDVLGEVPLPRPTRASVPDPGIGDELAGSDGDAPARPLRVHRERRLPELDTPGADHAFRGCKDLPVQSFDLTKVWPHSDYPLHEVGRMTLDHNVTDYHAEIEAGRVRPNNVVPGTGLSPDKMLLARGFSLLRCASAPTRGELQTNPGEHPEGRRPQLLKDGAMRIRNVTDPVYAPNSMGGRRRIPLRAAEVHWASDGDMVRTAYSPSSRGRRLGQPGRWCVRCSMTPPGPVGAQRDRPCLQRCSEPVLSWSSSTGAPSTPTSARRSRCGPISTATAAEACCAVRADWHDRFHEY